MCIFFYCILVFSLWLNCFWYIFLCVVKYACWGNLWLLIVVLLTQHWTCILAYVFIVCLWNCIWVLQRYCFFISSSLSPAFYLPDFLYQVELETTFWASATQFCRLQLMQLHHGWNQLLQCRHQLVFLDSDSDLFSAQLVVYLLDSSVCPMNKCILLKLLDVTENFTGLAVFFIL